MPVETKWIIKRNATDATSTSLRETDPTSTSLRTGYSIFVWYRRIASRPQFRDTKARSPKAPDASALGGTSSAIGG
jgi:hypothetical protein